MQWVFVTAAAAFAAAPAPSPPEGRDAAGPWPQVLARPADPVQPEMPGSAEAGRRVVADQALMAVVANAGAIEIGAGALRTGDNRVGDNAFAAFSGVLTQSWNSGVNANSQAATNVAWGSAGSGSFGFAVAANHRSGGR